MEGGAGGEHDEVHHEIRKEHSRDDVPPRLLQFGRRSSLALSQSTTTLFNLLLHLHVGLPGVKISRQRRPDHSYEYGKKLLAELNVRDQRAFDDRQELGLRKNCRNNIA